MPTPRLGTTDPDKCIHAAQIEFDEDSRVICSACKRRLVWLQASQLQLVRKLAQERLSYE